MRKSITDSQRIKMAHMTGLSEGGKQNRNHFTVDKIDSDLEVLIKLGFASKKKKFGYIVYNLTKEGLKYIKSFYTDYEVKIIDVGHFSNFFKL